jgi:acyl-CoA oxidase
VKKQWRFQKQLEIPLPQIYQTSNRFEIELAQILDGKQFEIIKVKSVISRPEFAYETSTDTARIS